MSVWASRKRWRRRKKIQIPTEAFPSPHLPPRTCPPLFLEHLTLIHSFVHSYSTCLEMLSASGFIASPAVHTPCTPYDRLVLLSWPHVLDRDLIYYADQAVSQNPSFIL